ncbi:MAG: DNA polymerase III subunit alpha, partial [Bacillota bacterium]
PGRGSGVGSIVAYSIGITNVDPMRYGLIFERFLNINRTSMPDFDIDFCYSRRGEVIQYVKDKYGDDHISQIITFGKLKRKAVIKDVARVFKLPFNEVNKVTSHIAGAYENDKKVHVDNLIDPMHPCAVPELIECYNNSPTWKRALDLAVQLEGMPKSNGMHAAGVVIYKKPAVSTIPLAKNGDEVTTQFDMSEVERLGLLKMDFLALMTLTDIKMAHDYVQKRAGIDIDFDKIGHDDLAVFELIGSGSTDAIFQLEGGGMKKFMARFRPKNIEEIIAGISLYRPGPMANIDTFLNNRKNPDKIQYAHPKLKDILSVTYGIMVYQEQAMAITRAIAGYDMTMADKFRAIISKKKVHLIEDERNMFIHGRVDKDGKIIVPGSVRNGVSEDTARAIFAQMEAFASYAFNKSHAAAYAMISYETAFYKKYYPVEFLASVLNNRIGKATETAKYMQVLKNENIPLLQPDINRSDTAFSPDETSIRYGLSCIKNVGKQAIDKIIAERENAGNFADLFDFIDRCGSFVNKRMIESLIYGGAFDCFNMTRATMIANYEEIIAFVDRKHKNDNSNQMDFFSMLSEEDEEKYEFHLHKEYGVRDRLAAEKDVLGMYITGHPLDGYEKDFDLFNFTTKMLPVKAEDEDADAEEDNSYGTFTEEENPYNLQDGMDIYTGGLLSDVTIKRTKDGKEMAICILEDYYGRIEAIAFSRTLQQCKTVIEKDALVRIKGRLSLQGEAKITIQSVQPWALEDKQDAKMSAAQIANDTRTLYINLIANDKRIWDKIGKILSAYEGQSIVKVQINKQLYQHPLKIKNLDQVARELIGIVGSQNIKIK